jgi:hypothetical protein
MSNAHASNTGAFAQVCILKLINWNSNPIYVSQTYMHWRFTLKLITFGASPNWIHSGHRHFLHVSSLPLSILTNENHAWAPPISYASTHWLSANKLAYTEIDKQPWGGCLHCRTQGLQHCWEHTSQFECSTILMLFLVVLCFLLEGFPSLWEFYPPENSQKTWITWCTKQKTQTTNKNSPLSMNMPCKQSNPDICYWYWPKECDCWNANSKLKSLCGKKYLLVVFKGQ